MTKPTLLPWPKIGPVIATISGRRRDATVRAMHAERRLGAIASRVRNCAADNQIDQLCVPSLPADRPYLASAMHS